MINYYLITKPGIILGNLITFAAGFMLASRGVVDLKLMLITLLALAFIIASGCIFNNYIDRHRDEKMKRTRSRAFVKGAVSTIGALSLGTILLLSGNLIFFLLNRPEALIAADLGFLVYVLIYSLWKSKTVYGTAIGSVAGAFPPVIGYLTVSKEVDLGAVLLFTLLVLWQMPHFYSIALMHLDDYRRAGIPVLPAVKGLFRTKVHMALYIAAFLVVSSLLTFYGYTGNLYLLATVLLSLLWLLAALMGFKEDKRPSIWNRQMFRISLIVINVLAILMAFDTP